MFLQNFGEQGSPISTTKLQNGVDTARHGLILRQHGATAYTKLLESSFGQYPSIYDRFCMTIIDFRGTLVSGIEIFVTNRKHIYVATHGSLLCHPLASCYVNLRHYEPNLRQSTSIYVIMNLTCVNLRQFALRYIRFTSVNVNLRRGQ